MYIKLIGSLFLLGSASAIGFLKAEDLKVRVRKLLELKRMIEFLQGELRFHKVTLSEAFAPHSMDTPIMMLVGFSLLFGICAIF